MLAGCAIAVTRRLLFPRTQYPENAVSWLLRFAGALLAFCGCVSLLVLIAGGQGAVAPTMLLLIAIFATVLWFVWRRRGQQETLLRVLGLAATNSLPLANVTWALSQDVDGWFGRTCVRLGCLFAEGMPLREAFDQPGSMLPPYAPLAAAVAERSGDLAGSLAAASSSLAFSRPVWRSRGGRIWQVTLLGIVGPAVIAKVLFEIAPSYVKIFQDFDVELPAVTKSFFSIGMSGWRAAVWLSLWWSAAAAAVLVAALSHSGVWTGTLPGFNWLLRPFHGAAVLRLLAVVVRAGRPIEPVLLDMAETYPQRDMRIRLDVAVANLNRAELPIESLRVAGVVSATDAELLAAAAKAGNLAWAMEEIAATIERRAQYRLIGLLDAAMTCLVVAAGVFVGFVAVACLSPLATLIQHLSA